MLTIVNANQKGGVGKTTTAVNTGAAIAQRGHKTLLIDTDPQGHCSISLGLPKMGGLFELLVDETPPEKIAIPARPNLWVIPSDKSTEKAKRHLVSMDYREYAVKNALETAADSFDVVVIDLAPSLDVLQVASIVASDWMVIPTKLDYLAVDGVNEVLRTFAEVAKRTGQVVGFSILPTFFDRTTRETLTQFNNLVEAFGANVLPPIPADTKAREAAAFGQTLWEYAPKCPALIGYPSNGSGYVGGYAQVVEKLVELWGLE